MSKQDASIIEVKEALDIKDKENGVLKVNMEQNKLKISEVNKQSQGETVQL